MIKTIGNRLKNALLLSFMGTFSWFIIGAFSIDFIFSLKFSFVIFFILSLLFTGMCLSDETIDFFIEKGGSKDDKKNL